MLALRHPLSHVHFVNGHSANGGNGALTESAEVVVDEDLERPVVWSREPYDDYAFGLKTFSRYAN